MNTTTGLAVPTVHEKTAYRKAFIRLIPFLMLCYVAAFLDRVNVSFAELHMSKDLGWSATVYGLGAGVFFIGYFLFELPSNLYMHRVGAKATLVRIMVAWGIISGLFAFVVEDWQFYILRFLLGVAEAGFYPGVLLFLTYWFPSHRRGAATSLFILALPVAGMVGAPLSGAILSGMDGLFGFAGWQHLFIVEAIPSIVLGLLCLKLLSNSPAEARWLTPAERDVIERDLAVERERKSSFAAHSVRELLHNKWLIYLIVLCFCQAFGIYGLTFWLPRLVQAAGVSGALSIGLVAAIPFGLGALAVVLFGRSSDARLERRHHLAVALLIGAVGLCASALLSPVSTVAAIAALSVAAMGVYPALAMFWNLPGAFFTGVGTAAALAIINSFGNLSGFASPYMMGIVTDLTGSATVGLYIIATFLIIGAALAYIAPKHIVNK
ncbi:MFS transporter [Microbacterium sp. LWH12-1.2]|uniref:MFS transporter n=1 Tax=Microbacterium sp. LWH12-1.2 TaxID=3135259 RepID=UPI00341AC26E